MAQAPATVFKIPTDSPQPGPGRAARPGVSGSSGRAKKASGPSRSPVFASGNGRAATRGSGEVIELGCGVTVYPARSEGGRWRAVWHEDGQRRQCEAVSEDRLAAKLEKVDRPGVSGGRQTWKDGVSWRRRGNIRRSCGNAR
jgi:hypothetical protein